MIFDYENFRREIAISIKVLSDLKIVCDSIHEYNETGSFGIFFGWYHMKWDAEKERYYQNGRKAGLVFLYNELQGHQALNIPPEGYAK